MGTFAGRPLCDPRAELDNCLRLGYPTDWADRANSFTCPLGIDSGRGWVLMFRQDLTALAATRTVSLFSLRTTNRLNAPNDLTLTDRDGTTTFKSLHVVTTRCITPGYPNDPKAVHLVELADPRRRLRINGISSLSFNMRITPTGPYATGSATSASVPRTWAETWALLWRGVAGSGTLPYATLPALPATPDGHPENLDYRGWVTIDGVGDFLSRLGLLLRWNPFTDTFDLVRPGDTQTGLARAEQEALPARLFDREPLGPAYGSIPAVVVVFFRKQGGAEDGYASTPFVTKDGIDPNPVTGQEGSEILFDDLPAIFYGDTASASNDADLQTRADARAAEFFRIRKGFQDSEYHKVYSGIRTAILPGSEVRTVTWRALAGDFASVGGPVTVADRTPFRPDPFGGWRAHLSGGGERDKPGLPQPPWFRVGVIEPRSGTTPPSGYDNYTLKQWNPSSDAKETIFDVLRTSVEGGQLANVFASKSNAAGTLYPVFATACDTPQTLWSVSPSTSLGAGSTNISTFTLDRTGVWLLTGTFSIGTTGAGAPDAFALALSPTAGTVLFANASTASWTTSLVTEAVAGTRIVKFTTLVRVRVAPGTIQVAITRTGAGFATATFQIGVIEGVNLG